MRLALILNVISVVTLCVGLYFPISAKVGNPLWAYGIVFVSEPLWIIGAIVAAVATFRTRSYVSSSLCAANLLAAIGIRFIPFYAG